MTHFTNKDKVFSKPLTSVSAFEFNEEVTKVFDDMISRSVPGYDLLVKIIALYADIFVTDKSHVYDLGCSTGVVSNVIAEQTKKNTDCRIIAVDNSHPMIEQCKETHRNLSIEWICDDIQNISVSNASLVVLNLTLQFIKPEDRQSLLARVVKGMNPGSALVLSEKIAFDDNDVQKNMSELYHGFKKIQGYSDLEISQKRQALENILIPDTSETHINRLKQIGFNQIYCCFQCFNFVSYLAIK